MLRTNSGGKSTCWGAGLLAPGRLNGGGLVNTYLLSLDGSLCDDVLLTPLVTDRLAARFYPRCRLDVTHSVTFMDNTQSAGKRDTSGGRERIQGRSARKRVESTRDVRE